MSTHPDEATTVHRKTSDSSVSTHPDEGSCILLVTVMNHSDEWFSRKDAFKWASTIIRTASRDAGADFEGELQKVIRG